MDILNNVNGLIKNTSGAVWRGFCSVWPSGKPKTGDVISKMGQPLVSGAIRLSEIATRREVLSLLQTSPWTRLAGLLGASAVAMGAYGAHALNPRTDVPVEYKSVFETANKYHFFHSLALLAVPLTRRPVIVGTLMVSGMFVFCGTCYVYSLNHNKDIIRLTPFGGLTLIMAWLAILL